MIAVAVAGLSLAYSYFIEPNRLVVTRSTLDVKDWNRAFDGLRIAVIGDIHGGSNGVTEERLREIVQRTNEQEPDLVLLLGDYVSQVRGDSPLKQRPVAMPPETIFSDLAGLKAKYGVFAVLGNHDGWFGDDAVAGAITAQGYKVLQNEVAVVDSEGQQLRILGLKDHLELPSNWDKVSAVAKDALAGSGDGDLIVLEHSPDIFPVITGSRNISPGMRLFLAAHTHGGQVWLPVFGRAIVPSSFGQKYAYGHVKENGSDMYITSGIGTSVLPIRFIVPPEIVVLTIKRSAE